MGARIVARRALAGLIQAHRGPEWSQATPGGPQVRARGRAPSPKTLLPPGPSRPRWGASRQPGRRQGKHASPARPRRACSLPQAAPVAAAAAHVRGASSSSQASCGGQNPACPSCGSTMVGQVRCRCCWSFRHPPLLRARPTRPAANAVPLLPRVSRRAPRVATRACPVAPPACLSSSTTGAGAAKSV